MSLTPEEKEQALCEQIAYLTLQISKLSTKRDNLLAELEKLQNEACMK